MSEGFTEIEIKFCKRSTEKFIENPLAKVFLRPVDPKLDGAPDYFDVIKEPMDLGTVKKKLENREYRNSNEWRSDIMKIWENSIIYNKTNYLRYVAEKMKKIAIKMLKVIPKNEVDLWYIKLHKAGKELQSFTKFNPSSSSSSSRSKSQKHKPV